MNSPYVTRASSRRPSAQARAQYVAETAVGLEYRRHLNPKIRLEEAAAKSTLRALEGLEQDWDGYGARPISRDVRMNAWHALEQFIRAGVVPDVSPNGDGTVSFEWDARGVRAHFQIGESSYSMYVVSKGGEPEFFKGAMSALSPQVCEAVARAVGARTPRDQVRVPLSFDGRRVRPSA